jgi:glutamate-1-semialdehyde 2,1-aminomutase
MMPAHGVDQSKIKKMREREEARFREARPKSLAMIERAQKHMPNGVPNAWMDGLYGHMPIFVEGGKGAYFTDVDGHTYLDMNQSDLSMNCGYGPDALIDAVRDRVATGSQFLLPTEDSIVVSEDLAKRFNLPSWQFTLSASQANTEVIRIARAVTGKKYVLIFMGRYHGHIESTMFAQSVDGQLEDIENGVLADQARYTIIVDFNDLDAVEAALKKYDIALILTEPALTNCGVILPEEGFMPSLKKLCEQYGALLALDETHTQVTSYGGLSNRWKLACDFIVAGKAAAAGIPCGLYGMTQTISDYVANHLETFEEDPRAQNGMLPIGGTLFGNALSMCAARVALTKILTPQAYEKTTDVGSHLITGLQNLFDQHGLPWQAHRLFTRSGYCFAPQLPKNIKMYKTHVDYGLMDLIRVYGGNRGIWDAINTAGAAASFVMEKHDVDKYLNVIDEFLTELKA